MPRSTTRRAALLLAALAALGCPEESNDVGFGTPTLNISPDADETLTTSDLQANVQVSHPPGQTPSFSFAWVERDDMGTEISSSSASGIDDSDTFKNRTWTVTVDTSYPNGRVEAPLVDSIRIVNSPPTVAPEVFPDPLCAVLTANACPVCEGDTAFAVVENFADADPGDTPAGFSYQWSLNGVEILGANGPTVDLDDFGLPALGCATPQSCDAITAEVAAMDDEEFGPARSRRVAARPAFLPVCANRNPPVPSVAGPPVLLTPEPPSGGAPGIAIRGSAGSAARGARPELSVAGTLVVVAEEPGAGTHVEETAAGQPLSVGAHEVCAIAGDGGLVCRGEEDSALTRPPEGRYSHVAVAADYACALDTAAGAIRCWGELPEGSPLGVPPEGAFVGLGVGPDAACALRASGELACWGDPGSPLLVAPEGVYTHLDVLGGYACARSADGATRCWGE